MNAIYLDPNMIPAALRSGYNGKKFKAVVCTETTIPSNAGLWSGGTRNTFRVINLDTGEDAVLPNQSNAPWDKARVDYNVPLLPGYAVVEHSMFCGKDMGLTFYVHPDNAAKLLPAPAAELTDHESIVLQATCSYKSSYNSRDRYDMARSNAAIEWAYKPNYTSPAFLSRAEWDAAKQSLIAKKLLNKAGAVTPAGRNARPPRY